MILFPILLCLGVLYIKKPQIAATIILIVPSSYTIHWFLELCYGFEVGLLNVHIFQQIKMQVTEYVVTKD